MQNGPCYLAKCKQINLTTLSSIRSFLRNGDADGPGGFDKFINLMDDNYYKVAEKNIGSDWNYPLWKSSTISLWKAMGVQHCLQGLLSQFTHNQIRYHESSVFFLQQNLC